MLDIKNPVSAWVLARLYDEDRPIDERNLMRQLCQQSFDTMVGDNDFEDAMKKLLDANYIEYVNKDYTDRERVKSTSLVGTPTYHTEEVKNTLEGYLITTKGIQAYRRQIISPLEKAASQENKINLTTRKKFENILKPLKENSDKAKVIIKLGIQNSPWILECLEAVRKELGEQGINIMM